MARLGPRSGLFEVPSPSAWPWTQKSHEQLWGCEGHPWERLTKGRCWGKGSFLGRAWEQRPGAETGTARAVGCWLRLRGGCRASPAGDLQPDLQHQQEVVRGSRAHPRNETARARTEACSPSCLCFSFLGRLPVRKELQAEATISGSPEAPGTNVVRTATGGTVPR